MIFVYVHPDDLDRARELQPQLFDEYHVVNVDREVPRGRIVASNTPIYAKPLDDRGFSTRRLGPIVRNDE